VKRLAVVLGVGLLVLTGCGDRPGYDSSAVEKYLVSSQAWRFDGTDISAASCPRHRDLTEGMKVTCTVTVAKSKVPFTVRLTHVHADKVHVSAAPAGVVIPGSRLTQTVTQTLPADSRAAKVDCGTAAYVVARVGQTVDCKLVLGSQTTAIKVTVKDRTGTVSVSS
jgi:hypothetical protein